MEPSKGSRTRRGPWSTKKRDTAPRGVYRHPSGMWAIRFTCGAGHIHKERVGPLKTDAIRAYHDRRSRAHNEPGSCPQVEAGRERERARAERLREQARVTFREYASAYLKWAEAHHRSWMTTRSQVKALLAVFGDRRLDEITTADAERFLSGIQERVSDATVNRYRDRLSGMFKRAVRLGLLGVNPVTGIAKLKEPGGRVLYLMPEEEQAIRDALDPDLRRLFIVSVHTGLRWSEQVSLTWGDADLHAGVITVPRSKHGETRQVPINSVVRSVLFDLGLGRERPDDPTEPLFPCRYRQADKFFPKVVQRARAALKEAGKNAARLDGYTWHGNRHTFASRLVMAGVDLRTVQELGGWKTLKMVARYAHLSPSHLHEAVERLVIGSATELARN